MHVYDWRMDRQPLPVLFMRFAMQAHAAAPSLGWLLLDILEALISRSVWADPQQWRGWLLAAAKHAPASFPAFLQVTQQALRCPVAENFLGACWTAAVCSDTACVRLTADIQVGHSVLAHR